MVVILKIRIVRNKAIAIYFYHPVQQAFFEETQVKRIRLKHGVNGLLHHLTIFIDYAKWRQIGIVDFNPTNRRECFCQMDKGIL